jgi:PAS domain-containing protein
VSEQSFRLIVDGIAGLVAIMTSTGEVQGVNRQVLDYFGKMFEQLKGWSTSDDVHPDDLPSVSDVVDAVVYLTEARNITGEVLHVDGGAHQGRW